MDKLQITKKVPSAVQNDNSHNGSRQGSNGVPDQDNLDYDTSMKQIETLSSSMHATLGNNVRKDVRNEPVY